MTPRVCETVTARATCFCGAPLNQINGEWGHESQRFVAGEWTACSLPTPAVDDETVEREWCEREAQVRLAGLAA